jgi:hypothetical protein
MRDDEPALGRDDGDDGGRRQDPRAPPAADDEVLRLVPAVVGAHRLDDPARRPSDGEADAVGEPVAGDGAGGVEPPALARRDRHLVARPRWARVANAA